MGTLFLFFVCFSIRIAYSYIKLCRLISAISWVSLHSLGCSSYIGMMDKKIEQFILLQNFSLKVNAQQLELTKHWRIFSVNPLVLGVH